MSNPNIASRFDDIYDSTHKAVLTFITSKCRHTADISDIFQDTYMELYQVLLKRGVDYITNDMAFVMRLAKQKVSRYYSLMQRLHMFVSLNATDENGDEVESFNLESNDFLVEDFVVDQMMLDDVRQFVHTQPEIVQKVFYLFYDVGLTIPEVARALSMSESGVKNKIYRTLKEIRRLLN